MEGPEHRPLVTIAALFGAGGSSVGREVAQRLGVAFLDRGVTQAVAAQTGISEESISKVEGDGRTGLDRLAVRFGRLSTVTGVGGGSIERLDLQQRAVQGHIEEFLSRTRFSGGVIVGHGGMVVLRSVPWALHVNLRGPPDARVRQGAQELGIDAKTAARAQATEDRARRDYVRRAYGVDGHDPAHYHLVLDSTALSLPLCVELVVTAALARAHGPGPAPGTEDSREH